MESGYRRTDTNVLPAQSEALIGEVERASLNPAAGIFGPESVSWKINRESALFLGAGRAALLQLAHPWVATALEQHSSLLNRPIERFHNTFRIVFTMIFGTLGQASAAARHLYKLHTRIEGELRESVAGYARGSHYQANEVAALRWVYATLVESAVLAYECVLPPLSRRELAAYYAESRTLAALFGIPAEELPADWPEFQAYCREMERSQLLGVTEGARGMAHRLLEGAGSSIKPPRWYRALTTEWLPERLRGEFDLPLGVAEIAANARVRRWLPRIYSHVPGRLRWVGPWFEARKRLDDRPPGMLTLASNQFWIGASVLPWGDRRR